MHSGRSSTHPTTVCPSPVSFARFRPPASDDDDVTQRAFLSSLLRRLSIVAVIDLHDNERDIRYNATCSAQTCPPGNDRLVRDRFLLAREPETIKEKGKRQCASYLARLFHSFRTSGYWPVASLYFTHNLSTVQRQVC